MLNKILIILMALLVSSCIENKSDMQMGEHLKLVIKEKGLDYIDTYEKAKGGNLNYLKKFLLFAEHTDTEASFDHFENVKLLAIKLGFKKITEASKGMDSPSVAFLIKSLQSSLGIDSF